MFEKNNNEKYAEKWFKENGFEIVSCKQYQSKTKYVIRKMDTDLSFDLPFCVTDIKHYMEMCKNSFEMHYKLKMMLRGESNGTRF